MDHNSPLNFLLLKFSQRPLPPGLGGGFTSDWKPVVIYALSCLFPSFVGGIGK